MGLSTVNVYQDRLSATDDLAARRVEFDLHMGGHDRHQPCVLALHRYIAEQFWRAHQAQVTSFMPLLLQMHLAAATRGVVGLNPGFSADMFLENYLSAPIEQSIAAVLGQPIDRNSIMEIGNLAVSHRGSGLLLFVIMTCALQEAGYHWMVFTATREVEKLIKRLGYTPLWVADADPQRLGDKARDWGRYYAANPRVMVGNLAEAAQVVRENPRLADVFERHDQDIRHLAQGLRMHHKAHAEHN